MANEITVQAGLLMLNGFNYFSLPGLQVQVDQTGTRQFTNLQNIGFAAHEIITLPSWSATQGWATFRNVGLTNYIEIGIDVAATFHDIIRVLPGEIATIRLVPSLVYYAKANVAAEDLQYTILED